MLVKCTVHGSLGRSKLSHPCSLILHLILPKRQEAICYLIFKYFQPQIARAGHWSLSSFLGPLPIADELCIFRAAPSLSQPRLHFLKTRQLARFMWAMRSDSHLHKQKLCIKIPVRRRSLQLLCGRRIMCYESMQLLPQRNSLGQILSERLMVCCSADLGGTRCGRCWCLGSVHPPVQLTGGDAGQALDGLVLPVVLPAQTH